MLQRSEGGDDATVSSQCGRPCGRPGSRGVGRGRPEVRAGKQLPRPQRLPPDARHEVQGRLLLPRPRSLPLVVPLLVAQVRLLYLLLSEQLLLVLLVRAALLL